MFELYAMWTWAPQLLAASYAHANWNASAAKAVGFATVAIGGIGCVLAGLTADRAGRCWTTIVSLVASGGCALVAGALFDWPGALTVVCLIWGFSVVADSAQFSAAISELCDPRFVGTALTIQTCAGFLLTTLTIRAVPWILGERGTTGGSCRLVARPRPPRRRPRLRHLPHAAPPAHARSGENGGGKSLMLATCTAAH